MCECNISKLKITISYLLINLGFRCDTTSTAAQADFKTEIYITKALLYDLTSFIQSITRVA